jgi:hypothetical protein
MDYSLRCLSLRLQNTDLVHGIADLLTNDLILLLFGFIFGVEFLVVPEKNLLALVVITYLIAAFGID